MTSSAAAIESALTACCDTTKQITPMKWSVGLLNGHAHHGTVFVDGMWLQFQFSKDAAPASPEEVLHRNAGLYGPAKLCVDVTNAEVACAEAPITDGFRAEERVAETVQGLRQALFGGKGREKKPGPKKTCELDRLLDEAGWGFTKRGEAYSVRLDTGASYHSASLFDKFGAVNIRTVLGTGWETHSKVTRTAVGFALLRASAIVRMVRATVQNGEFSFEAGFATGPDSVELGHALAALSTACRVVGQEVAGLLENEQLARIYLAAQGQVDHE